MSLSKRSYTAAMVWILRIVIGAVFVFSGAVKAIDPWGFIIKLEEYLAVWHTSMPHEILVGAALCLGALEFTSGVLLMLGAMRRTSIWIISGLMAVMLPLTVYIAVANPVDDCGCFGDAITLSNTATALKNVVICAALVYLWRRNTSVPGIAALSVQWLLILVSVIYCVVLAFIGLGIQPVVDFRPFRTGTSILGTDAADDEVYLIYEKDGVRETFGSDALPDSTWTYIGRDTKPTAEHPRSISMYDGTDDVAEDVIEAGTDTPTLLLLVSDPDAHDISRCHQANQLARYMKERDGNMAAVVACHPDSVNSWKDRVGATYPVYSGEDTSLKEVARGVAALVYLHGDTIMWKRTLYSFPPDFPHSSQDVNVLENIHPTDDLHTFRLLTLCYVLAMAFILMLKFVLPASMTRLGSDPTEMEMPANKSTLTNKKSHGLM